MSEEVVTLQDMKNILEKFYSNDANTIRYAHNRAIPGTDDPDDPTLVFGMVFNVMRLFAGSVYDAGSFDLLFLDANRLTSNSIRGDFEGAVANATTIPIGKQWKNYMRTYLEIIIDDHHWNSPIYHELMEQYDQAANGFQMRRALYDIFSEVVRIREQSSQPVPPQPTTVTVTKYGSNVTYSPNREYATVGEYLSIIVTPNEGYVWANENPISATHGTTDAIIMQSGNQYNVVIYPVQYDIVIRANVVAEQPSADQETITLTPTASIPSYTNPVYTPLEVSFSRLSGDALQYITIETPDSTQLYIKSIKKMNLKKENGVWVVDSVETDSLATNNRKISVISTASGFKTQLITDDTDAPNHTGINFGLGVNTRPDDPTYPDDPKRNNRAAALEVAPYTITGYTYIPTT